MIKAKFSMHKTERQKERKCDKKKEQEKNCTLSGHSIALYKYIYIYVYHIYSLIFILYFVSRIDLHLLFPSSLILYLISVSNAG